MRRCPPRLSVAALTALVATGGALVKAARYNPASREIVAVDDAPQIDAEGAVALPNGTKVPLSLASEGALPEESFVCHGGRLFGIRMPDRVTGIEEFFYLRLAQQPMPVQLYYDIADKRKLFVLIPPIPEVSPTWRLLYKQAESASPGTPWLDQRLFDTTSAEHPCGPEGDRRASVVESQAAAKQRAEEAACRVRLAQARAAGELAEGDADEDFCARLAEVEAAAATAEAGEADDDDDDGGEEDEEYDEAADGEAADDGSAEDVGDEEEAGSDVVAAEAADDAAEDHDGLGIAAASDASGEPVDEAGAADVDAGPTSGDDAVDDAAVGDYDDYGGYDDDDGSAAQHAAEDADEDADTFADNADAYDDADAGADADDDDSVASETPAGRVVRGEPPCPPGFVRRAAGKLWAMVFGPPPAPENDPLSDSGSFTGSE